MMSVIQAAEEALGEQRMLRRMPGPKRKVFGFDIGLIALGCRSALLVDAVVVQDPENVYADFLRILRQKHEIFNSIEHVLEPSSQQSFFVNTAHCKASVSAADVSFVLLQKEPQLLDRPPPDILAALEKLKTATPLSLPNGLLPRTLTGLAAVLLGYSVGYVPDGDAAFLAQVALDVYACTVRASDWEYVHQLLKFSCPAALGEAHPEQLAPARIVARLTTRLEPRLKELGLTLMVQHSTETMDRVAL
ncbi:hypothetical protein B0H16DRAFT_1876963 [Mycena metata]|uniref:Uncharacterized protein n=1 Tax=Mycena metata TaxID=1033252 RepID=A0AAD7KFM7_9AGAR|nr:hypothetical protein B0H16DRAFT_1876963 [Mycena metata]